MSHDPNDPFPFADEDERTVLRPKGSGNTPHQSAQAGWHQVSSSEALPALGGINPLEKAASRLLPLLMSIRQSTSQPDPNLLRNLLVQELKEFKQSAQTLLGDPKKATQASYVMCTALDDAAMNTPWGHQANWAQHNLLTTFHNEVIGGERFFKLLKSLGKNPRDNIDLLELMYLCLALGYEGYYRMAANGQNTLIKIRVWLHEIISSVRENPDKALAVSWQGTGLKESTLPRLTVLWVAAAAALTLCSLLFFSYRYNLGARSETAIASFFNARVSPLLVNSITPPPIPLANSSTETQALTLAQLLQPQVDLEQVEVEETFNEGRIRIIGDNLFASGKAELNPSLEPLVNAIAQALDQYKGSILVTGHSDNIPITSGRFSSNLELSEERASSVARSIAEFLSDPTRISAEGLGSLEPIADNETASGRASNRRVEVSIFY